MNPERLVGIYHYCAGWHGGQWSQEYRVMCRALKALDKKGGMSRREEFADVLSLRDYAKGREVYMALCKARQDAEALGGSGVVPCACCGHAVMVDHIHAEDDMAMCDGCVNAECDPRAPCKDDTEGSD